MSHLNIPEQQRDSTLLTRVLRRPLSLCGIALIIGLCPLYMGFFFSVLEEIDIVAIREMNLRDEGEQHTLEALITIRNTSMKTLKLLQSDFELAIVTHDGKYIPLGSTQQDEILLEQAGGEPKSDTDMLLSLPLGSEEEVYELYQHVISTTRFLLLELEPTIDLRVKANFKLAVKTSQAWNYSNGIQIDWVVTPEISRRELIEFLQAISGGEFIPPTPVPTPTGTPVVQD